MMRLCQTIVKYVEDSRPFGPVCDTHFFPFKWVNDDHKEITYTDY